MTRKKFIDRDGFKTCTKCEIEFSSTTEFFHGNNRAYDRLSSHCKHCNNLERSIRQKFRLSHNIPRRCIVCNTFFWAARADMNKIKRKYGLDGGIFCSRDCQKIHPTRGLGMKGKSWDGRRVGVNNPNAKYDIECIRYAKVLINEGNRLVDISKKINISESYLSLIKSGRVWASVVV